MKYSTKGDKVSGAQLEAGKVPTVSETPAAASGV